MSMQINRVFRNVFLDNSVLENEMKFYWKSVAGTLIPGNL